MRLLPINKQNPNVLVGNETSDDAGVYRLSDELAIIQTVDYFTPIVDDPYSFGQIAAANALSDIYAMGGSPITALNIVGFPVKKLGSSILADILKGAADKITEAGAVTIGGHSIDDQEPKFGLAVTGTVHPDKIWRNIGAQVGDLLVLTKPIGVGIITTGIKRGLVSTELERKVEETMKQLNKQAADTARMLFPSAVTDVTGFGLLGHAYEMANGSQVSFELCYQDIPILPQTYELALQGSIPGGTRANLHWLTEHLEFAVTINEYQQLILADAVTSGGLLLSMKPQAAQKLLNELPDSQIIGKVIEKREKAIYTV